MTITTLTDEEEKELRRLHRFYWKEALRCEGAKAYLAGCILLGSALEAMLILMVNAYSEDAEKTGRIPRSKGSPKPLLRWDLVELLGVAKAAGWLPAGLDLNDDWNWRKAQVGDYAEVVRLIRNLAHPARYQQDHGGRRVTNKYLQQQFEIVLACRDRLAAHNNRALLKHFEDHD